MNTLYLYTLYVRYYDADNTRLQRISVHKYLKARSINSVKRNLLFFLNMTMCLIIAFLHWWISVWMCDVMWNISEPTAGVFLLIFSICRDFLIHEKYILWIPILGCNLLIAICSAFVNHNNHNNWIKLLPVIYRSFCCRFAQAFREQRTHPELPERFSA